MLKLEVYKHPRTILDKVNFIYSGFYISGCGKCHISINGIALCIWLAGREASALPTNVSVVKKQ